MVWGNGFNHEIDYVQQWISYKQKTQLQQASSTLNASALFLFLLYGIKES